MTTTHHPPPPAMPRALRVDADRLCRDAFAVAGDPTAVAQVIRDHAGRLHPDDRMALLAAAVLLTFGERLPALLPETQPTPTREAPQP